MMVPTTVVVGSRPRARHSPRRMTTWKTRRPIYLRRGTGREDARGHHDVDAPPARAGAVRQRALRRRRALPGGGAARLPGVAERLADPAREREEAQTMSTQPKGMSDEMFWENLPLAQGFAFKFG